MPRAANIAILIALAAPVAGAWAEDRYGPPPSEATTPGTQPAQGWLSWPGKTAPAEAFRPSPISHPIAADTGLYATRPASIASVGGQPARFYSVHREFGVTPDPIPLAPRFFADAANADLAAPPAPLPPHPVPGSQAAASPANSPANRARAIELDTADSTAF